MSNTNHTIIGTYDALSTACRDYDTRAAVVAERIANYIWSSLPQVRVEHVGSTSVLGCAGKGIVDLMIATSDGEMELVKETLEKLGFQPQPHRDPFPEDRPMRVGSTVHDDETFMLHVHIIPADSPEVDEILFFRACLRADQELLKAYIAAKRKIIAGGVTDSLEYSKEKGKFIKAVLG